MRTWNRRALALSSLAALGLAWSGCEAKKQTEYVAGVSTQVQVPRDLKTIRVDISVGGANVFCRAYKVYDGVVRLPRSLGSFPANEGHLGEPVTVTIVGFTEDIEDTTRQDLYQCLTAVQSGPNAAKDAANAANKQPVGPNARVLRRSRQPYVKDEVLFLPMALKFSCYDVDCETSGQDKTCKGGLCVDAATNEKTLPKYSPDLLDGSGGACFHAKECMGVPVPAVPVKADECLFAVPNTASAPPVGFDGGTVPFPNTGDGVNVLAIYDGGYQQEILDKDPDEGFTVPDPSKPQQFKLSKGLCAALRGFDDQGNEFTGHRITGLFASGVCRAKTPFQPLCTSDQLTAMGVDQNGKAPDVVAVVNTCPAPTELKPPTSLLMVVADDTANSTAFYKEAGSQTVGLSLSDPAFQRTKIGLAYFPAKPIAPATAALCGGATRTQPVEFDLGPANKQRDLISVDFIDRGGHLYPENGPVDLDGALVKAYSALTAPTITENIYRRAVMVIGNRSFSSATCGGAGPVTLAQSAFTDNKIKTFVVMLSRDVGTGAPPTDPNDAAAQQAIQLAGAGGARLYDARINKTEGLNAFRDIVNDLATCVYDVKDGSLKNDTVLSYTHPVSGATTLLGVNSKCNSETAATDTTLSGWGLDPVAPGAGRRRLYICGQSCNTYRDALKQGADNNALYLQPAPAVPVFAFTSACAPKATPAPAPSGSLVDASSVSSPVTIPFDAGSGSDGGDGG